MKELGTFDSIDEGEHTWVRDSFIVSSIVTKQ